MMSDVHSCLFGAAICIGFGMFFILKGEIATAAGWGSGVVWSLIACNYAFEAENY